MLSPFTASESVDYHAYMKKMEAEFDPQEFMTDDNLLQHMNPDGSGTINFVQPGRDTEDGGASFMPDKYKCDACRILAMMMENEIQAKIDKFEAVKSGAAELDESEVLDTLEELCMAALRTFKQYVAH